MINVNPFRYTCLLGKANFLVIPIFFIKQHMVAIMLRLLKLKWLTKEKFPLAWWSTKRGEWIIVGERRKGRVAELKYPKRFRSEPESGSGSVVFPSHCDQLFSCHVPHEMQHRCLWGWSVSLYIFSVESTRSYNSRRRLMICLTATIYSSWDWCQPSAKATKLTYSDKMHLS